ncbi:MAG: phosphotransferase family protein [Haliea sp.]|uniref:phosphotransferase family protein n=1 Tax=Haliea sp. TaxID=1932666 RepID=UPI0032ED7735
MTSETRKETTLDPAFSSALQALLGVKIEGFRQLQECQKLTAGASQETFRILVSTDQGDRQFALRRCPPTQQGGTTLSQIGLETEAQLLQLAATAGIPVPRVIHVLTESDELGEGFLMAWLEGETLGQRIVKSEKFADIRPHLARQCGETLARLHAIDIDARMRKRLPTVSPAALVQETWEWYQGLNVPAPMIDYSARWLLENLPRESRQTLVHGDFRNGNLMINESGLHAVLDWELTQIGDPVRDLGWLCVNSWRFGKAELPVGGFGTVEDLLAGYQAVSGIEISREDLRFWQVFGSFWWSITTLAMASTWRSGETPSLERPVIGRRSSEAQMDCVNLLVPGKFEQPEDPALDNGTQLPMPAELLEGVRTFLKDEVAASANSHFSFLAKVAANSLGIAQREFLHGPRLALAEHGRLQALLGTGGLDELRWKLAEALRSGLPLKTPGLADHLRLTVAGQLSIDQPHYSALSGS